MPLLSVQHYTAQSQTEADSWFGELDRQLAALRAGTETPAWCEGNVAEQDPHALVMVHSTTPAAPYIYCRTEISVPD